MVRTALEPSVRLDWRFFVARVEGARFEVVSRYSSQEFEEWIRGLYARRSAPSGLDLETIRIHVSEAGFDPLATYPVDRRVIGLQRANGQTIQHGDLIPTAELHYLRHVVSQQEWSTGTTQEQYE